MPPLANDPIEEATAEGGGEKGKMHFEDHGISRCGGRQPENHDDNKHQQKSNEMKENNLHMAMINVRV